MGPPPKLTHVASGSMVVNQYFVVRRQQYMCCSKAAHAAECEANRSIAPSIIRHSWRSSYGLCYAPLARIVIDDAARAYEHHPCSLSALIVCDLTKQCHTHPHSDAPSAIWPLAHLRMCAHVSRGARSLSVGRSLELWAVRAEVGAWPPRRPALPGPGGVGRGPLRGRGTRRGRPPERPSRARAPVGGPGRRRAGAPWREHRVAHPDGPGRALCNPMRAVRALGSGAASSSCVWARRPRPADPSSERRDVCVCVCVHALGAWGVGVVGLACCDMDSYACGLRRLAFMRPRACALRAQHAA